MSYYNPQFSFQGAQAQLPTPPGSMPYAPPVPPVASYGATDSKAPGNGKVGGSARNLFAMCGVILLGFLCIVPFWNALALMKDTNYVFWAGRSEPSWLMGSCIIVVVLYVATIFLFFGHARPQVQTEQTVMMIASIFITLLGLVLMISALPLSWQSVESFNNIMHRCDFSEQTHRLYEYSQVLHNIRRQPACAEKFSVEECAGYQESTPYTQYLKTIELDFRCSGFCYRPPALLTGNSTAPATEYPPTLFSNANFKASCDGMAARDMKNYAGDIGFQTFYQGVYLVLIAIMTGFLKLVGFCVRRDRDIQYTEPGGNKPHLSRA